MLRKSGRLVLGVMFAAVLASCGGSEPAAPASAPAPAATPAPAAPATPPAAVKSVADLFPDGPAKALVLNNCAACHNVACSVIGQRTSARWDSLREAHSDKGNTSDLDPIFAYLKTNFNDAKPAPQVPPAFLEGGCTPF